MTALILPVVWLSGAVSVVAIAGSRADVPVVVGRIPTPLSNFIRTRPAATAGIVGAAFSAVCVVGALILTRIPFFAGWVTSAVGTASSNSVNVFLVALVTGATEEAFFRIGVKRLVPTGWYVVGSTMIYAVVTAATGNGALVMASVMLGLVAAVTYQLTDRWYVPVIVHGLWSVGVIGVFPLVS